MFVNAFIVVLSPLQLGRKCYMYLRLALVDTVPNGAAELATVSHEFRSRDGK